MKRAGLLLLCPALMVVVSAAPAFAQESHEPGLMTITFLLRPGGNDAIDLCTDHDFQDQHEALEFARTLAPKLGFGSGEINYDEGNATDCVTLTPDRGFVQEGPRPHERTFRFDSAAVLDEAKTAYKFDVVNVAVCVPSLPSTVSPRPDETFYGSCDHPLDHEDDWYSDRTGSIYPIEVRYVATPETMLFGILGNAAFWVLTAVILFLLARRQRRKQWAFFIRHRVWAWILNVSLMLVLFFGAVAIGPYWSSWIQSLQLYVHIGVPGEIFFVAVPALTLCVFMVAGPISGVRTARLPTTQAAATRSVAAGDVTIPRLTTERWSAREIAYISLGTLPFIAFIVLVNNVRTTRGVHVAFLGLAALFLLGDFLWRDLRRWTARSHDETSRLTLVRSELDGLGAHTSHAYVSESLVFGDVWIPQPGRISPVVLSGRTITVWTKMLSQSSSVLAGAAIDSLGLSGEAVAVPFLLFEATVGATSGEHLPHWVIPSALGIGVILLVRIAIAIAKRRRLVRAAARSPRAASYLRGLLLRRWIAARRIAPKRPMGPKFFARRIPATQIWRGAMKSAARFAAQAGMPPETWQAIVQEVMATDLG